MYKVSRGVASAQVRSEMSCRVQSGGDHVGETIDESLDRAAVQVQPGAGALNFDGIQEGGGGYFNNANPGWSISTHFTLLGLGSSLDHRDAWRRNKVVRDLQAPATR